MSEDSIFVQNLCKEFKDFTLDHVSFCVPKGRIVGFIGENGAGKSTTINLILNERGLIYKDITIFLKSIEKRFIVIVGVIMALLVYKAGIYAGLIASFMFAISIAIQNIMCFANDEKVDWKKYQLTMPISGLKVVASKYIAVICSLVIGVLGSMVINLLCSIIYQSFELVIWGASVLAAIIITLTWTGICLPFSYWFGFYSSQSMGFITVIPMSYLIKYFEDGTGYSGMVTSLYSYIAILGIAAIVLFVMSMVISAIGYERNKQ